VLEKSLLRQDYTLHLKKKPFTLACLCFLKKKARKGWNSILAMRYIILYMEQ
jgi:hypothetical protein